MFRCMYIYHYVSVHTTICYVLVVGSRTDDLPDAYIMQLLLLGYPQVLIFVVELCGTPISGQQPRSYLAAGPSSSLKMWKKSWPADEQGIRNCRFLLLGHI